MLLRNKAGQGIYLYAYTVSTGLAKPSDATNIVGSRSLDGGSEASLSTGHPTEIGHGVYWQPLTQAETNGEAYAYTWASSTSGVVVRPEIGFTAAIQLADGVAHGGTPGSSTATFAMKAMNVTNPGGDAVAFRSTGGEGQGFFCHGHSFANGVDFVGGDDLGLGDGGGTGFYCRGGDDVGSGAAGPAVVFSGGSSAVAASGGEAVKLLGGGNAMAVLKIQADNSHGISIIADGTGMHGITSTGGTDGAGFNSSPDAVGFGGGIPGI